MKNRIAYLGIPGSFSYSTAKELFNSEENEFIGLKTFKEIFNSITNNNADYGIIPIENSLAGSVHVNYDLLAEYDLKIVAEKSKKIDHTLIALKGTKLEEIKTIESHPKAFEQCEKFFEKHPTISKSVTSDTANAVKDISLKEDRSIAAIAGKEALETFDNLEVIQENISDNSQNFTRFFVIAKKDCNSKQFNKTPNKCSLIFSLSHKPGSLYNAIRVLAECGCNLTKIESRPIHGKMFEYLFYVDFELEYEKITGKTLDDIIQSMQEHTQNIKILGVY